MCMECRSYPCHSACPNADEPPVVCQCSDCGEDIRVGDDYYKSSSGLAFCEDCISLTTADEEDLDDDGDDAYDAYRDLLMEEAA